MPLTGTRTFVGFGFGAIQSGLFLYETHRSGAFGRVIVAEVVPAAVSTIRDAGGYFTVNIAHADRIEHARVGPIEIENPSEEADRARLIEAIAQADEIGTAVPSVNFYTSASPGSIHRVLAEGLRRKATGDYPRAVIYTAENNNHAAEILEAAVMAEIPEAERGAVKECVRFLNTVIGKMSGVPSGDIQAQGLHPVTPGDTRAFLVEAFNRILISRIDFPQPFARGLRVFEEKSDLLPFEEAKLFGHNGMHALAAYLAQVRGLSYISDLRAHPDLLAFARAALIAESGAALVQKYKGVDALFTPAGITDYTDDLVERMTNPYLRDEVARVGRDPARKLGWDDRLIGAMRLALAHGIEPGHFAVGAAAALRVMHPEQPDPSLELLLTPLWPNTTATEQAPILDRVEAGRARLNAWIASGFQQL
jgi:mannitol-1-phosphate 5-dehydrogenase